MQLVYKPQVLPQLNAIYFHIRMGVTPAPVSLFMAQKPNEKQKKRKPNEHLRPFPSSWEGPKRLQPTPLSQGISRMSPMPPAPQPCLPVSLTTWERTACSVLHKPSSIILIHPSKKKMHPKVQETHPRRVRSQPAWRGNSLKIGVNHLLVHKRPEHLPLLMWKQEARALFFLFAWVVLHTCGAHPKRVLPRGSIIKQNSDAGQIHSLA